ncbi:MAG: hypothetical protein ACLQGP_38765 [Isosphaeraceae bacterium]
MIKLSKPSAVWVGFLLAAVGVSLWAQQPNESRPRRQGRTRSQKTARPVARAATESQARPPYVVEPPLEPEPSANSVVPDRRSPFQHDEEKPAVPSRESSDRLPELPLDRDPFAMESPFGDGKTPESRPRESLDRLPELPMVRDPFLLETPFGGGKTPEDRPQVPGRNPSAAESQGGHNLEPDQEQNTEHRARIPSRSRRTIPRHEVQRPVPGRMLPPRSRREMSRPAPGGTPTPRGRRPVPRPSPEGSPFDDRPPTP